MSMLYRSKMRFSIKTEDEQVKNQRLLEEKIQMKKQQIRAEFETFEHEQSRSQLTENEMRFKNELDNLRSQKKAKLEKLTKLSGISTTGPKSFDEKISTTTRSKLNAFEQNHENLREKREFLSNELLRVERQIESGILNENSIKNKIEEFVRDINFVKTKNEELKYLSQLAENRFKSLEVIRFNAQTKEVIN